MAVLISRNLGASSIKVWLNKIKNIIRNAIRQDNLSKNSKKLSYNKISILNKYFKILVISKTEKWFLANLIVCVELSIKNYQQMILNIFSEFLMKIRMGKLLKHNF